MKAKKSIVSVAKIEQGILSIRGQKVMLDSMLAVLYDVTTGALNQAVKRNMDRFPDDFMFQLSAEERQEVITNCDNLQKLKFSPSLPYAFTEHGAIMLASVLNSNRAIEASIYVVRVFVRLRQMLITHKEVAKKLSELESRVGKHDSDIKVLVDAIRQLMTPPEPKRRPIGFQHGNGKKK